MNTTGKKEFYIGELKLALRSMNFDTDDSMDRTIRELTVLLELGRVTDPLKPHEAMGLFIRADEHYCGVVASLPEDRTKLNVLAHAVYYKDACGAYDPWLVRVYEFRGRLAGLHIHDAFSGW